MSIRASHLNSKELTANAETIYYQARALENALRKDRKNQDLFQTGLNLDFKIEEIFHQIIKLPVQENMDAFLILNATRKILVRNHACLSEETPSMKMSHYASVLVAKMPDDADILTASSPSVSQSLPTQVDNEAIYFCELLTKEDVKAIHIALWELTGKRAGNAAMIGKYIFESADPMMKRLKAEALTAVALKKFNDRSTPKSDVSQRAILNDVKKTPVHAAQPPSSNSLPSSRSVASKRSSQLSYPDKFTAPLISFLILKIENALSEMKTNLLNMKIQRENFKKMLDVNQLKLDKFETMKNENQDALSEIQFRLQENHTPLIKRLSDEYNCDELSELNEEVDKIIHQTKSKIAYINAKISRVDVLIEKAQKKYEEQSNRLSKLRSSPDK